MLLSKINQVKPPAGNLQNVTVETIEVENPCTTNLMREMSMLLKIFEAWGFNSKCLRCNFRRVFAVAMHIVATIVLFLNNVVFGYRAGKLLVQVNRPFHCVFNMVVIGFIYHFLRNIHRIKELLQRTELPSLYVCKALQKYVKARIAVIFLYVLTTLVFKLWLSSANESYKFLQYLLPVGQEYSCIFLSVLFDLVITSTIHVSEILIGCFYSCICAGISKGFGACKNMIRDLDQRNMEEIFEKVVQTYLKLCESVNCLEELYSTFMFFWIACITILVIMWGPEVIITGHEYNAAWTGLIGTFALGLLAIFVDVSMAASSVTIEAQNVTSDLFAILKKMNWEGKQKDWAVCTKNILHPPQLSAGKAFYLNRSLICSVFSVISMYTVIIYQIQPQD